MQTYIAHITPGTLQQAVRLVARTVVVFHNMQIQLLTLFHELYQGIAAGLGSIGLGDKQPTM
jgi:hypothetical protein